MRVLIDGQACQTETRFSERGRLTEEVTRRLASHEGEYEVWLLLNEALPSTARRLRAVFEGLVPLERIRTFGVPTPTAEENSANAWRARAAKQVREHYIANIKPDIVFIPSLFEGFRDDAAVSIGEFDPSPTTVVFVGRQELDAVLDTGVEKSADWEFVFRQLQSLKRADLVVTFEESTRQEALDRLNLSEARVKTVGHNRTSGVSAVDEGRACAECNNGGEVHTSTERTKSSVVVRDQLDALTSSILCSQETLERQQGGLAQPPKERPNRLLLAYVSPLRPERTGIADYSAELIPELARFYDVELITDQETVSDCWLSANFPIRSVRWFEKHASRYDRILYHIGNNPLHAHMPALIEKYPGVLVLHDFFLAHMVASDLQAGSKALYQSHGYPALLRLQNEGLRATIWEYPANYEVVRAAAGVIVHAAYSKYLAQYWYGAGAALGWVQIPHLRGRPSGIDRSEARRKLEIGSTDFVVCSFGLLGPTKLNHRLLEAWSDSTLADDRHCHLVFVGANDGGEYGYKIRQAVKSSRARGHVKITGFANSGEYKMWLSAADASVQLRTDSRGEMSGTILDCLVRGVPLIFNAHGTAAEIPDEIGLKLNEGFDNNQLTDALERLRADGGLRRRLGDAAVTYTQTYHHPHNLGRLYRDSIESFAAETYRWRERQLLRSIVPIDLALRPDKKDLATVADVVARDYPWHQRQLLVDVSAIAREDIGTGIQRVVRAQLRELLMNPPAGYRVEPVYLTDSGGEWHYRYARKYASSLLEVGPVPLMDRPADVRVGDVFHGLDLFGGGVVSAGDAGLYERWRARGVRIYFMVYDLLPVLRPSWFPEGAADSHERWLKAIARDANGLVCISASVARELEDWFRNRNVERPDGLQLGYAHLGANLEAAAKTKGFPSDSPDTLNTLQKRPTFLMVGTIEPRKGYVQAVDAFENLWQKGADINLVIVGKAGWKQLDQSERRTVPEIVDRLANHPELNQRLFWLTDVSDEYLETIYSSSSCLIAASEAEGFGLPLIEAAKRKLSIVARDIAVFREVAGDHAFYFDGKEAEALADALDQWLGLYRQGTSPASEAMPWMTWEESTRQLLSVILDGQWATVVEPRMK